MPDREKVMRGLECCCTHIVGMSCGNCPYEIEQREDEGISDCTSVLAYDALDLLKEQEPIWNDVLNVWTCPSCGQMVSTNYCRDCGRSVKWE